MNQKKNDEMQGSNIYEDNELCTEKPSQISKNSDYFFLTK